MVSQNGGQEGRDGNLAGVADGFNIMPPVFPAGLDDFVDDVVPLLRRRKLRAEYEGRTLRSHYGAEDPERTVVAG
ncbi:hypothetical protein [Sphaerisporangium corydalis]|uniref:Uncharacterized protein n=1 Tax=Sphaerisporangium corydalis TaxID=1441875 RepID=A0ABV9EQN7_9ACTN|nr:hypothetical protein [Sphaerisporangium corydalis]